MSDRWNRLAPLTGVVFAALMVGLLATSKTSPDDKASGAKVIAFYEAHRSGQRTSDILAAFAAAFLVFFAGALRSRLRSTPANEALSSVVLAGAVLFALGLLTFGALDYALAAVPGRLSPSAAQALSVLDNNFTFPVNVGGFVFGLAAGLAILRGTELPKWLGALALVIGLVAVTPVFWISLLAVPLWALVVGVLMWRRGGVSTGPAAA